MQATDRNAILTFIIVVLIGAGVAFAGSQGGVVVAGVPLFALAVALAFLIQWLAFIPAYLLQTEKFFDLTGSLTYISVTALAVLLSPQPDGRAILLLALVVIWAARLGTFLFRRIQQAGKDDRFDDLKPSFLRFLNVWTLQGLWVTFTLAAASGGDYQCNPCGAELDGAAWLSGLADLAWPSKCWRTPRKAPFAHIPKTRASSFVAGCGPGRGTPITSARSCCGLGWH